MNAQDWLTAHGPALLLGASALLLAGCVAVAWSASPVERRRFGVLAGAGVWVYLVAGLLPLPRWSLPQSSPAAAVPPLAVANGWRPAPSGAELVAPSRPPVATDVRPSLVAIGDAPASAPPAPAPVAGAARCAWLFLAGSAVAGLWLVLGWLRLRWLLRRCRPAPAWLSAGLPVLVTDARTRPFCAGVWRPRIVLPARLADPRRADAARAVLAHELAHARAGDCRVQLLFALLTPLCWWQPLFWWLRAQVRFASELLADDAAARGGTVRGYVGGLLQVVDADAPRIAHAGAVSIFHRPSEFYRRIHMLLGRKVPLSRQVSLRRRIASAAGTALLVTVAAGFCGVSRAQEPQGQQELQQEAAQLRQMVKVLQAEVAKLRQLLHQAAAVDGAATPGEASAQGVPVLTDVPIVGALFRPEGTRDYVVQAGDSLAGIADKVLGDPAKSQQILERNPGLDPRRLRVGQKILLPAPAAGGDAPAPAEQPPQPTLPAPQAPATDHSLTDLLNVVTRRIELRGQLEIARSECELLGQQRDKGVVDAQTVRVAAIKMRTLEDQLRVADLLLKGELDNAKARLARLERLREAGLLPDSDPQLGQVRSFVQVISGAF